jgi:hypothetical protein
MLGHMKTFAGPQKVVFPAETRGVGQRRRFFAPETCVSWPTTTMFGRAKQVLSAKPRPPAASTRRLATSDVTSDVLR